MSTSNNIETNQFLIWLNCVTVICVIRNKKTLDRLTHSLKKIKKTALKPNYKGSNRKCTLGYIMKSAWPNGISVVSF
jgi:hypothetical protein